MNLLKSILRSLDHAARFVLRGAVRVYQLTLSPLMPNCCRFEPTCSHYALLALQKYSAPRALLLIAGRLLRCNPLFRSGYDPLPEPGCRHH